MSDLNLFDIKDNEIRIVGERFHEAEAKEKSEEIQRFHEAESRGNVSIDNDEVIKSEEIQQNFSADEVKECPITNFSADSTYELRDSEELVDEDKVLTKPFHRFSWVALLSTLTILLLATIVTWFFFRSSSQAASSIYLNEKDAYATAQKNQSVQTQVGNLDTDADAYTVLEQQTVNDVPLRLLVPTGGRIELMVGRLDTTDATIVLAAQAADYRADNGKISGAFVYRGELLSRGHPKLGFCAIIGREVTMGMSPETPLFERAVEQSGYFFRQFSLVHECQLGENTPAGKSIRRALCYDGRRLFIADTEERESLHDFAQALVDMGVREAVALVGSIDIPLYRDEQNQPVTSEIPHFDGVTETYLVWRR